jgi:hypothetical protein
MDVIDVLGNLGRVLLSGLIVVLPLVAWQWVVLSSRHWRGTFGLLDATLIAGAMIGIAALVDVIPAGTLNFDAVVAPGGVWDLSATGFLRRAAAMAARGVPAMADRLVSHDAERDLRVWLSLAGAVWLLRLSAGLLRAGVAGAGLFLLTETVTFVVSIYGAIYAGLLLIWLFNQLNVWWLLLLIVLLQDFRNNDPPYFARLPAATGSFALYAQPPPPREKKHKAHGH